MPMLLRLPYMLYERHTSAHTSPEAHGVWLMRSNGEAGVHLLPALSGEATGLENPNDILMPDCGDKVRYCIMVSLLPTSRFSDT